MIPYESIFNTAGDNALAIAQGILESGWSLSGYPSVQLGEIPWAMESARQRSWNFHIHSWDMLNAMLKAHSDVRDRRSLEASLSVALEWASLFSPRSKDAGTSMAWYDMSVGIRAYRLAYLIDAVDESGILNNADRQVLWDCLLEHQVYLGDDRNIHFHNNHGYYQAAGQVAMGRRFAHRDPSMKEAYEQGRDRLDVMLKQQFAEDGVHKEHSPDYHRMVCETLKGLIDSGLLEGDFSLALYRRIESSLAWFVLPNGHLANFGDTDFRSLQCSPAAADARWGTPEMKYVVSSGAAGTRPDGALKVFPGGGYFVVRKSHEGEPAAMDSYLAQTACFHSRTHKHADDLSFIWSDRGSDILVDAGRYGYVDKTVPGSDLWKEGFWYADPNRVYCESSRAHNTLEFDERSSPRRGVKPYRVALRRWVEHKAGVYVMETECKQFGSIRHARVLAFLPSNWLIVFDWFKDNLGDFHDVRQWFHFACGLDVRREGGGYRATMPGGDMLCVEPCFQERGDSEIYCGQEQPWKQGWWSPSEKTMLKNNAVCFRQMRSNTGVFATLFSFSDKLSIDRERSATNISGRTFRIAWNDGKEYFQLGVSRPAVGDMEVEYSYTRQASTS